MARRRKRRAILLEFGQIILQAQHRWLRPAELCEIIRNHTRLGLSDKPAYKPLSRKLFLYDRKVRYRDDGHRWKKPIDGRYMKEAHEKLKDEGVEVLHCYYAHGEENGNFQRRIYWMIDQDLSHIALVHYREVESNRKKFQAGDATISNTAQASELETAFTFASTGATLTTAVGGGGDVKKGKETAKVEVQESCGGRKNNFEVGSSNNSKNVEEDNIVKPHEGGDIGGGKLEEQTGNLLSAYNHQASFRLQSFHDSNDAGLSHEPRENRDDTLWEDVENGATGIPSLSFQPSFPATHSETVGNFSKQDSETFGHLVIDSFDEMLVYGIENQPKVQQSWLTSEGTLSCSSNWPMDQSLHSNREYDVTTRFLEEVYAADSLESMGPFQMDSDMQTQTNTDTISKRNDTIEGKADHPSAMKSQLDGLFTDDLMFDDEWMNEFFEHLDKRQMQSNTGVNMNEVDKSSAPRKIRMKSYMLEPSLSPGQLFIEGRDLEYQDGQTSMYWPGDISGSFVKGVHGDDSAKNVHSDLVKRSGGDFVDDVRGDFVKGLRGDFVKGVRGDFVKGVRGDFVRGVRGDFVKDVRGDVFKDQASMANTCGEITFEDQASMANCSCINTLLNMLFGKLLAFCGRKGTVSSLISLGSDPEALTDPTTKHPTGETPADLASEQGHKRIAGYLAESALSAHLSSLNLDSKEGNSAEISGAKAVSASSRDGESTDGISLIAVSASDELALSLNQSLIVVKSHKAGKRDEHVDAAVVQIQNKFRSWKGRKDFLIIRQRIIKIQAHVRGHQVRKIYRKKVWSVGIVEKIILRWIRKRSGLRGFKPEPLPEGPSMQVLSSMDDDYDLLKEGSKQTEERFQKTLARVKSIVQCPEARDQYHRLLNVVTEIQETKVLNSSEGISAYVDDDLIDVEALLDDDDLIDIEALLDEDIFMPTAAS